MSFDNSNTGTLNKNNERTDDKHAEYKGRCDLVCPMCNATFSMWIDAWVRTKGADMSKFFSFKFKPAKKAGDAL
jgi:hypothetical protein